MSIRHREVAVAVIFDAASENFLLCQNRGWSGYAFPMKRFETGSAIKPAEAALRALKDWDFPLQLQIAGVTPLDYHIETLRSGSEREVTVYEYHVFAAQLASALPPGLPFELRLMKYDQLQDTVNVTSATKAIARSIVEDRQVAVAVISRETSRGREFLLINNPNHGYFFPATRIKTDMRPAEAAVQAAVADLGYDGPWDVVAEAPEVPALKQSARFGSGERRFHYHLRRLHARGIDLQSSNNALESSLTRAAGRQADYWRWATEQELREEPSMSRSMPAVLLAALQLTENSQL